MTTNGDGSMEALVHLDDESLHTKSVPSFHRGKENWTFALYARTWTKISIILHQMSLIGIFVLSALGLLLLLFGIVPSQVHIGNVELYFIILSCVLVSSVSTFYGLTLLYRGIQKKSSRAVTLWIFLQSVEIIGELSLLVHNLFWSGTWGAQNGLEFFIVTLLLCLTTTFLWAAVTFRGQISNTFFTRPKLTH